MGNCDEMIKGGLVEESTSIDFSIDEFRKNNFATHFQDIYKLTKMGPMSFKHLQMTAPVLLLAFQLLTTMVCMEDKLPR